MSRSPSLDFSIAHRWAQASGPQHNPQWAMGSVLKSQLNPQPINGRPSKPIKSPFLCPNIALARIKSIFYANTNLYIPLYHIVIVGIQTSLSIRRLQLIPTTLVDLNYYWQYEPMTELCGDGIVSRPYMSSSKETSQQIELQAGTASTQGDT
ncbi:hypothetical protein ACN38_g12215 [Penicillium nordicum]|uniref:Uncharacterized protein n=1 Tax=Penicillium nordicum TaxID=229535 RepID=A0A0M9WA17_9EURO|nr:hypothetical protein ACN38_g12215 [Penicillium nordicum]